MKEIFQTLRQEFKQNPKEMFNIITFMVGVFGFLWVVFYIANQFNIV